MRNVRNQVQLIGNLGREVELKTTSGERKVATLSLAVNFRYTNQIGQQVENTDWFRVIAWGYTAENMEKVLHKGDHVMVQGRLSTRTYEDPDRGTQYVTEIIADQFLLISSAAKTEAQAV